MNNPGIWAFLLAAMMAASGLAAPATEGAQPGEWTMDFAAAKTLAAEKDLPLLLNFTGSDWCGWCKIMDRQVFSQEAWKAYAMEHFVLVWIDFPKDKRLVPAAFVEQNQRLSREFDVGGYPTYILLDPDGQTRLGQAGASREATPESFIEELETLRLASDKSVAALKEKMTDDRKAELDQAQAARDAAAKELEDWIQTQPERTDENTSLYNGMQEKIETARKAYLQLLKAAKQAAPQAAPP
ncbi:MAG: thioredoxin family protein [Opitutae bacterium]|nr:thioredoxin family protein [Opitutae bacterium]